MTWRLAIATLALTMLGAPASSQGLNPFGSGFSGPRWSSSSPTYREYREQRRSYDDDYDDDGWDSGERRRARRGPEVQEGGARPAITPMEPETVAFPNTYGTGTVVIDTAQRKLYYVLSETEAYQYPISVGRDGFRWTGTEMISRKVEWPDWHPPEEMRDREPHLPKKMTGGLRNPLGAMALYLGDTLYRIHGTSDTKSVGRAASSGCFRMRNEHVAHLASLVDIGTIVEVMKRLPPEQSGAVAQARS